jgi:hypothetical protein
MQELLPVEAQSAAILEEGKNPREFTPRGYTTSPWCDQTWDLILFR